MTNQTIYSHPFVSTPTGSANGSGLTLDVVVNYNSKDQWNAQWSIRTQGNGYEIGESLTIARPVGVFSSAAIFPNGATFTVTGIDLPEQDIDDQNVEEGDTSIKKGHLNHFDAVADYVQFPGMETKSHQDGPEHTIVYVNEQIDPVGNKAEYQDLALGAIRINSAKEWTNFTQFSAYFKKGIKVPDLIGSPAGPNKASNNFVEIANALLTDETLGAGKLIGTNSVGNLYKAAKFCQANGFTWDGIISQRINLRDFLYEHGGYNLLDFTVIGGKFNLVPAVPYDEDKYDSAGNLIYSGTYEIDRKANIGRDFIKALFTDGNIKDLQVSFLNPEERQLFKANVLFRKEKENGFAETENVVMRLHDTQGGSDTDPIETYDLSGFCTTRKQAKIYAQYILKLRKEITHGLSFKTAPQYVVNLQPGEYFRLVSEATHVDGYNNGVITAEGKVISKNTITGSKPIYYWKPGTAEIIETTINFDAPIGLRGVLFTVKNIVTSNRVYKVETISYSEDGLVEVSGSHAPLTSTGSLAILDGWDGTPPIYHFDDIS